MAAQAPAPLTAARLAALVKEHARELGFETTGITDLRAVPHADALDRWLDAGLAGTMAYMHRQADRRKNPASIRPGTTRAVVVTRNYFLPDPAADRVRGTGRVAKYARGPDYHVTLRQPLDRLATFIRSLGNADTIAVAYVDAGPLPERELAQRAGLGWIGKNTMLLDPDRGSYFFIGTVLTSLGLAIDPPFEADRCGSCTRCLDACPTDAFVEPRVLDATRCISYLTIEYRGTIPQELGKSMGDWVFGCDVCQDVCPWNAKFARASTDPVLALDGSMARLDLDEMRTIDDDTFDHRFGSTPLERPGAIGMRRNATVASANQGHEEA